MSIQLPFSQIEFLEFGSGVISKTRQLILDLWKKTSISSELKADQTPVSEVDLRCEELVRAMIRERQQIILRRTMPHLGSPEQLN